MKDDQWIWIGVAAGAAYLIYKSTKPITNTLDTVGGGIGDAFGGVGEGIGTIGSSTGDAYSQILGSAAQTISDDISLFNIKKDAASIYGFLQDRFNQNPTQQPNQPTIIQAPKPIYISSSRTSLPPATIKTSNPFYTVGQSNIPKTIEMTNPFAFTPNMSSITGLPAQGIGSSTFILTK